MANPTDEQIKKWRDRWYKYPGLVDQIVEILMADKSAESTDDAVSRMWKVNDLLKTTSEENFEIYYEGGIGIKVESGSISVPVLDLKGIDLSDRKLMKIFIPHVLLQGAVLWNTWLSKATMLQAILTGAELYEAHLEEVNLYGAHIEKANLASVHLERANLIGAHLESADLLLAHLEGSLMSNAYLEGANLVNAHLEGAFLWEANLKDVNVLGVKYDRKTRFLGIKLSNCYGNPIFVRFAKDQEYIETLRITRWGRVIYWIWNVSSDCGRSATRLAFFSLVFIFLFAWIYASAPFTTPPWLANWLPDFMLVPVDEKLIDPEAYNLKYQSLPDCWQWFFASFNIFTNLGIGNPHPQNCIGVIIMFIETLIGYISLGLLISVGTTKFARRS